MRKRKDSENFPALEVDESKKGIIDPKEVKDLTQITKKKREKEKNSNLDSIEQLLKDTKLQDISKMVEEPNQELKQKLRKKRIISKREDIVSQFEKMFNKIQMNSNLLNFKDLVIIDFEGKPSLEELEPTKPKEIKYKSRKSRQTNFRKGSGEMLQLTKGKMGK